MGIYTMDRLSLCTLTMYLFDTISSMPGIKGAKILGQVLIDLLGTVQDFLIMLDIKQLKFVQIKLIIL